MIYTKNTYMIQKVDFASSKFRPCGRVSGRWQIAPPPCLQAPARLLRWPESQVTG